MEIVFATNNKHKLFEVQKIVPQNIIIHSLESIKCFDSIPEDGNTLEINSLQKAQFINKKYSVNCFADDTGLEIDTLNGAPGVYSARYAGEDGNSILNMQKVLKNMQEISNRKARFRTVISLILDNKIYRFEGIVEGEITKKPFGIDGFGYDPIFKPKGYSKTFAQLSIETKNIISHRGIATQKLIAFLSSLK